MLAKSYQGEILEIVVMPYDSETELPGRMYSPIALCWIEWHPLPFPVWLFFPRTGAHAMVQLYKLGWFP